MELWVSRMVLVVKNPPANAGVIRDTGSVPVSGRSPGGGNSNPLQYSCLENPMDKGAWQATVHRVTRVRHDWRDLACTNAWNCENEMRDEVSLPTGLDMQ